jgi:prepilin-type processing-associated H-X9-DG protein
MSPYLEQVNLFNSLNFDFPLAHKPTIAGALFWPYFPANSTVMATQVALFLCPSDGAPPPAAGSGPTNYAFCAGSGINGGDATGADGVFILGTPQSVASVMDGTSQTAAASEQSLGIAGPYSQSASTPVPVPWSRAIARVVAGPLTDDDCALAGNGWLLNKGSSWWDGNYQNTLYNHYLTPDANRPDCIVYHNPGWKAARSYHSGGVNLLYCDGHAAFFKDSVNPALWRGISTRAGGEIISGDSL